ncbi:MAG: ABC-F family ATP-binding cassette domain-containing protein [SAR324 cluster bacterium]|nr:ABC-F family ATP-binding cassette domain-containing protein [SAR324 cluster bacterium]
MTLFVSTHSISKSYGAHALFSNISIGFFANERLGLIGPNGSGKTTLLKIIADLEIPDCGQVSLKRGIDLVYLPQEDHLAPNKTIEETLFDSLSEELEDSERYQRVREIASQKQFIDMHQKAGTLSGGWRKRLAITSVLIQKPDMVLLDEPTNHLDLEGILWLESILKQAPFAFVLISHDRDFLENITNRIVELNRQYPDGFLKVEGSYSAFLRRRETVLSEQMEQQNVLSNKVRRELEWLQRGPRARTTKAQFRIDDAQRLQQELSQVKLRNEQNKKAQIDFEATHRKSKKLLEVKDLAFGWPEKNVINRLNLTLSPGMCLGLLGQNGSGKTTLLNLLNGDLAPNEGVIKVADDLKIVTFDQNRERLDPKLSLKQTLSPAGDQVIYRGRSLHIVTWAKRFLFPREQLGLPVSQLSGGEQARVLIANLMLKPADILLLDEPTNNLDIPTLEVLEESLEEFPGAVVLITHDRFLLDRLSDRLLFLDGKGNTEFFADYEQWLQFRNSSDPDDSPAPIAIEHQEKKVKKITYEEKKELNRIEKKIQKAEEMAEALQQQLRSPELISDSVRLEKLCTQLKEAEEKTEELYIRWEELESLDQ